MSAKIISVGDDIFFWSQIHDAAQRAGHQALRLADDSAMQAAFAAGGVALVVADLAHAGVDACAWAARWKQATPAPRLVAYASHVDVETQARARAAGFDSVLPKSRFAALLHEIVGV